jgi:hypothetical protein
VLVGLLQTSTVKLKGSPTSTWQKMSSPICVGRHVESQSSTNDALRFRTVGSCFAVKCGDRDGLASQQRKEAKRCRQRFYQLQHQPSAISAV